MAQANAVCRITRTTIDDITWTAIVAPIDCNNASVRNVDAAGVASAVVLKIRSDPSDATSEDHIPPGQQYAFDRPFTPALNGNGRFRFLSANIVAYCQLASGSTYAIPESFS